VIDNIAAPYLICCLPMFMCLYWVAFPFNEPVRESSSLMVQHNECGGNYITKDTT
jgi:hypothetical protein